MINFEKFVLENGLRVIVHEDDSTPMVCLNIVYNVGSKHEDPEKTGFAHLFEHLMFGGSANIKDFDTPLQLAGGDNNAFTNSDLTNFYDIVPADNIETAFWLESDRMLKLNFSKRVLNTQKKVVIEEFKETCLNEPYGDMWHHLSELAYKTHPYKWPTIGKEMEHIANATIDDVEEFFYTHYRPNNAVLVVAGRTKLEDVKRLAEKWFGPINRGPELNYNIPFEPPQQEKRTIILNANVPNDAIFLGFHMSKRLDKEFYVSDLITDILANGRSSRFYKKLFKEKKMFSTIDAFITGYIDPGLVVIEAKPMPGISINQALDAIWEELEILKREKLDFKELEKLRNTLESSLIYSEVSVLNKAISLAYFEVLGNADWINKEAELYQSISQQDIMHVANKIFIPTNCNELIYQKINN